MSKNSNKKNSEKQKKLHVAMREIRPYVDFDYDLRKKITGGAAAKIIRYAEEIRALSQRGGRVYRSRNPENLRSAQTYGNHSIYTGMLVAFLPVEAAGDKALISKGKIKVVGEYVTSHVILFNQSRLASDTLAEVAAATAKTKSNSFTILCGEHSIAGSVTKRALGAEILRLTEKYAEGGHYFGQWLKGVKAHVFKNQADKNQYILDNKRLVKKRSRAKKSPRSI